MCVTVYSAVHVFMNEATSRRRRLVERQDSMPYFYCCCRCWQPMQRAVTKLVLPALLICWDKPLSIIFIIFVSSVLNRSIHGSMCMFVRLWAYLRNRLSRLTDFTIFFVPVAGGSDLLWQSCNPFYTSSFLMTLGPSLVAYQSLTGHGC